MEGANMCKAKSEGGRRCAAHLYPAYVKALEVYKEAGEQFTPAVLDVMLPAFTSYASTSFGLNVIRDEYHRLLTQARVGKDISGLDYNGREELMKSLRLENPALGFYSDVMNKGIKLSSEYRDREEEIKKLNASRKKKEIEEKTVDISTSTKDGFNAEESSAYKVLEEGIRNGRNIYAPVGSILYEVSWNEYSYESTQTEIIGLYDSKEAARAAIERFIYDQCDIVLVRSETVAPWIIEGEEIDPTTWNGLRDEWFKNHSLKEIVEWYQGHQSISTLSSDPLEFTINEHKISEPETLPWSHARENNVDGIGEDL